MSASEAHGSFNVAIHKGLKGFVSDESRTPSLQPAKDSFVDITGNGINNFHVVQRKLRLGRGAMTEWRSEHLPRWRGRA